MSTQKEHSGVMIPRAVFANFFKLNLLLLLVVLCTALGLRLHLEPRAWPVTAHGEITPDDNFIFAFWTMETDAARNLLHQGIPLLEARNNPQTLFQRTRGFFRDFLHFILEVDSVSLFTIHWKELPNT